MILDDATRTKPVFSGGNAPTFAIAEAAVKLKSGVEKYLPVPPAAWACTCRLPTTRRTVGQLEFIYEAFMLGSDDKNHKQSEAAASRLMATVGTVSVEKEFGARRAYFKATLDERARFGRLELLSPDEIKPYFGKAKELLLAQLNRLKARDAKRAAKAAGAKTKATKKSGGGAGSSSVPKLGKIKAETPTISLASAKFNGLGAFWKALAETTVVTLATAEDVAKATEEELESARKTLNMKRKPVSLLISSA